MEPGAAPEQLRTGPERPVHRLSSFPPFHWLLKQEHSMTRRRANRLCDKISPRRRNTWGSHATKVQRDEPMSVPGIAYRSMGEGVSHKGRNDSKAAA